MLEAMTVVAAYARGKSVGCDAYDGVHALARRYAKGDN